MEFKSYNIMDWLKEQYVALNYFDEDNGIEWEKVPQEELDELIKGNFINGATDQADSLDRALFEMYDGGESADVLMTFAVSGNLSDAIAVRKHLRRGALDYLAYIADMHIELTHQTFKEVMEDAHYGMY
ncbi:hypothetical protein OAQ99_04985 [Candidatus Kapabacteria bacterium]|nr:hypothetical protein [Candidatus Kapabacteria bacterium]